MAVYDVIVLGVGGVGSAAAYHLAQRGASVLGIDRFPPGHDRGSSHGHTRLIRQAYFEHPNYVPMVQRAFSLWHELEQVSGELLYRQVGLLQIGPPSGEVLSGVRASAQLHGLHIEQLAANGAMDRFPGFRLSPECQAIFEHRAGYLLVERCVIAHARQATQLGAELHSGEEVRGWRADGSGVIVETDRATYSAGRLVISAGPWASQMLGELGVSFEVLRKPLYWWQTSDESYQAERGCPGFLYDLPQGCFYGVPQIDSRGVKVAQHTGGATVLDPLSMDRELDPTDQSQVASFVRQYLPSVSTQCTDHTVCMYTMSRDGHFVLDRHPEYPQVSFAAGLSGHGFKFTCALGEALSQLALDGKTILPIEFLSASRPGLRP